MTPEGKEDSEDHQIEQFQQEIEKEMDELVTKLNEKVQSMYDANRIVSKYGQIET